MIAPPLSDDLDYAALVAEARSLLPELSPGWTDHNPSDPGILLMELCAWLVEMVLYRLEQVPERSQRAFLSLLNDEGWTPPEALEDAIHETVQRLRDRHRAVTPADFEDLISRRWTPAGGGPLRRVHCLAERNLDAGTAEQRAAPAPGHVSVVVVPDAPWSPTWYWSHVGEIPAPAQPSSLLYFDGAQSYLKLPADPLVTDRILGGLTVAAWIFPTRLTNGQQFLVGTDAEHSLVLHSTDRLMFGGHQAPAGLRVSEGRWNHVAVVQETSLERETLRFYLDGVFMGEVLVRDAPMDPDALDLDPARRALPAEPLPSSPEPPTPLSIGGRDGSLYFAGFLRDVCLWNIELSGTEVAALLEGSVGSRERARMCLALDEGAWSSTSGDRLPAPLNPEGRPAWRDASQPRPLPPATASSIKSFLDERRALTTRVHVREPRYVDLRVGAELYLRPDANPDLVRREARAAIWHVLHPLTGGRDGKGWPLGKTVPLSEVWAALSAVPGVDFVGLPGEDIHTEGPVQGLRLWARDQAPGPGRDLPLALDELPSATLDTSAVRLFELREGTWRVLP